MMMIPFLTTIRWRNVCHSLLLAYLTTQYGTSTNRALMTLDIWKKWRRSAKKRKPKKLLKRNELRRSRHNSMTQLVSGIKISLRSKTWQRKSTLKRKSRKIQTTPRRNPRNMGISQRLQSKQKNPEICKNTCHHYPEGLEVHEVPNNT